MKKKILLCIGVLFANLVWSQQQNYTVSPTSNVEVGINTPFSFSFKPVTNIPQLASDQPAVSSYRLTAWFISSANSNMNNSGNGSFNDNSQSLNSYGINQNQTLNFPIKWDDNSNQLTDIINISTTVNFYNSNGYVSNYIYTYSVSININRILAPIITNTILSSCSTANVQVCATNFATANQFDWSISGGTITSGQGSSCINVTPTLTGNLTASCTVKRSSGLSSYTRNTTRNIERQPFTSNAKIIGSSYFCTSSVYSLDGLLANQTVQWSLSRPALFGTLSSITNPTTTLTAGVKNGELNLIAKISNACGDFVTITKEISIGVNGLNAVLTTPSGFPYSYPYYNVPESCSAPLYVFKTSSENTNLNNPTKKMQFTCNGITVIKQPIANYYFYLYASDFNINQGNSFIVDAKVGNSCGFAASTTTFTLYRPTPCQCGTGVGCYQLPRMANQLNENKEKSIFKLFPIPSNDIINIELENTTFTSTKSDASIYNMFGVQITKFEILENKATIDVKQFSKGIYILKINSNGNEENHQIIIK